MSNQSADIDHLLRFETADSCLTGKLRIGPTNAADHISRDALIAFLSGREVHQSCILNNEIDALIEDTRAEPGIAHERVVARGSPPEEGSNARIELSESAAEDYARIQKRKEAFRLAQEQNTFEPDTGSPIDFYNDSAFVTVRENEHIADFIEHTLGNDGMDIYGRPIAAKPGKPITRPCDASCRLDNDGAIISLLNGLLQYDHDRVSVQSTLDIPGYVDFSTGNVDFPGDVVIHKGVRDRFRVNADFALEIHKLVEAAHLRSAHSIKLHQGMAGREAGSIRCGENLESGYLDAVDADIRGDCIVEKEITNCNIRIAGQLLANTASVRGGLIEIAMGGHIANLGSERGVVTEIVLGAHPILQQKLIKLNRIMPKIDAEIQNATKELGTLRAAMGKGNPELQTELLFLESNLKDMQHKREQLIQARERILGLFERHTRTELTVHGNLYAKSKIWLPGESAVFERDLKGELTIRLDRTGKPVIAWGEKVEPLSQHAKVRPDDRVPARPAPSEEDTQQQAA